MALFGENLSENGIFGGRALGKWHVWGGKCSENGIFGGERPENGIFGGENALKMAFLG